MLQQLSIKNFALIDHVNVDFKNGFSIITGETGAGKSILLGGLGLILGKRADLSVLKNKEQKCIIEGEFDVERYKLKPFFEENDVDYEAITIIRREILPSGKSRAFVNDTPVRLDVLSKLSERLIDIHSQHQTLQLADVKYQFKVIDALAKNQDLLKSYSIELNNHNQITRELETLLKEQQEAKLQYDYNLFLFNELEEANLKEDEQEVLENTLEKLNNIEAVKQNITEAISLANNEEFGVKSSFISFKNNLTKLASFSNDYEKILERFNSVDIEFADIIDELEKSNDTVDVSPQEIESFNDRLQLIYDLQKKHNVSSNIELLHIQNTLSEKVNVVENANQQLEEKQHLLAESYKKLNQIADKIHTSRKGVIPTLLKELESTLSNLAMPNTTFKIEVIKSETLYKNGKDELQFLFSANKGGSYDSLKKVASGGEMSRIMLAVKALLSKHSNLPTILFDEIDTGVSGEVSNRIASIMQVMSVNMQVISITHLPQVAAKGNHHYKVYKHDTAEKTVTNIKELNGQDRINEIAEMLSGKELSNSAIAHAKQLLG